MKRWKWRFLGHVIADPTLSTRKLAVVSGLNRTSIQRILKHHKFHPYKIQLQQKLNEDNFDRRLQFCEEISERVIVKVVWRTLILFIVTMETKFVFCENYDKSHLFSLISQSSVFYCKEKSIL